MLIAAFIGSMLLGAAPLIAIDAGHGGTQYGAKGVCGVYEKDITQAIAAELEQILRASGQVAVLTTRSADTTVSLEERAARANQASADLFLSIHANASTSASAHGVETFFLSNHSMPRDLQSLVMHENDGVSWERAYQGATVKKIVGKLNRDAALIESQRLAMRIQDFLEQRIFHENGERSRARGVLQAPFIVLREASMPAVLVEVGFLTHPQECALLKSRRAHQEIAEALAGAVLAHLRTEMLAKRP